jgi:hypothetical protein
VISVLFFAAMFVVVALAGQPAFSRPGPGETTPSRMKEPQIAPVVRRDEVPAKSAFYT